MKNFFEKTKYQILLLFFISKPMQDLVAYGEFTKRFIFIKDCIFKTKLESVGTLGIKARQIQTFIWHKPNRELESLTVRESVKQ
jgi:hypothetical protein